MTTARTNANRIATGGLPITPTAKHPGATGAVKWAGTTALAAVAASTGKTMTAITVVFMTANVTTDWVAATALPAMSATTAPATGEVTTTIMNAVATATASRPAVMRNATTIRPATAPARFTAAATVAALTMTVATTAVVGGKRSAAGGTAPP